MCLVAEKAVDTLHNCIIVDLSHHLLVKPKIVVHVCPHIRRHTGLLQ